MRLRRTDPKLLATHHVVTNINHIVTSNQQCQQISKGSAPQWELARRANGGGHVPGNNKTKRTLRHTLRSKCIDYEGQIKKSCNAYIHFCTTTNSSPQHSRHVGPYRISHGEFALVLQTTEFFMRQDKPQSRFNFINGQTPERFRAVVIDVV
jgi:hypothetical protein